MAHTHSTAARGSHSGADDIDHGIDGADFMKIDSLDGCIVNLSFGLAQRLEDADCSCLRRAADGGLFDALGNLRQPATVHVFVIVRMFVVVLLLLPENLPRQVLLALDVHIDFGR